MFRILTDEGAYLNEVEGLKTMGDIRTDADLNFLWQGTYLV